MAHISGLVAGGAHPSPFPFAHIVTSTTQKTLRGPRGGIILCSLELSRSVDRAVFPMTQGGPLMHVIAAKAVCFKEAMQPSFREYANNVVINARALADALTKHGLRIVSGGTDNHLILVDLRPLGLKGNEAEKILEDVSIVVNKNAIPNDPERPRVTSGLRLGSAALTSRGFGIREMDKIADMIVRAMKSSGDAAALESVKNEAESLASSFPVPGIDL